MCTGKLGCGKSVLLANMIDDLYMQSERLPVAYFFCRYDIPESLKAHTVMGSLSRQLLQTIQNPTIGQQFADASPSVLDFEGLLRLLRDTLPRGYRAYIIVDGLDECDDHQKQDVIRSLRELQDIFPLLACLSFTFEAASTLKLSLEQFTSPTVLSIPDENPDIPKFISLELERRIKSKRLVIGEPTLITPY